MPRLTPPTTHDRILSIILAIVVLVAGFFVLRILYSDFARARAEGGSLRKEISGLKNKQAALSAFEANYASLKAKPEISKFPIIVPSSGDVPGLLSNIEALARAKGLVLSTIVTLEGKAENQDLDSTTIHIDFTGKIDYPLLKAVLDSLEKNLRMFEVVNFSFKPGASSLSFDVKTFSLSAKAPAPSPTFNTSILQNPKFLELEQFGNPLSPGIPGNTNPLPLPPQPAP